MIIDEINRGNVVVVLGEFIMFLEVDKWGGAKESFEVILFYLKFNFVVLLNFYIIGIMNIVDCSVEAFDIVLCCCFSFMEVSL